jgi:hypothetical protein
MYIVVLHGGGDGGGFIITSSGIKPIPPWNPDLFKKVTDVNHVVQAGRLDAGIRKAAGSTARSLVREIAEQVDEQVKQALDAKVIRGGGAIAYFDEDGGWFCGTPPKKPPIPLPPKKDVTFESLGLKGFA